MSLGVILPNGSITFGSGASGLDPIPPTLSKNTLYSDFVTLVRVLSHTSGNTTVISAAEILSIVIDEVGKCAKENWAKMQPYYLQSNTFNIQNTSFPYKSVYSTLNPYVDKFIGAFFLQGVTRFPVISVSAEELQLYGAMTTIYANSVFGTFYDGFLELFVGSAVATTPNEFQTEIYYYRQPQLAGITTSNYTTKYIDLPDSYIPDLIDKAVLRLEMTKQ